MDQAMADLMRKALVVAKGRVEGKGGAAEMLGVHPMTLRNRMKKLDVPFGKKARSIYKSSAPATVLNWPQSQKGPLIPKCSASGCYTSGRNPQK